MVTQTNYVPPPYIPLGRSDAEVDLVSDADAIPSERNVNSVSAQWSSGICACFDDMPSCCIGLIFPCYLFGKNAEFLGSGTLVGSCTTHFILWTLVNTFCCMLTEGFGWGLPGCFVSCYACGYRKTLRSKYNLQEAPCGDFLTHFFCHLCALCQEYREIRERSGSSEFPSVNLAEVSPPSLQTMESPASSKSLDLLFPCEV